MDVTVDQNTDTQILGNTHVMSKAVLKMFFQKTELKNNFLVFF